MDLESENTNDNPTHEDDSESRMEDENGNTTNTDTENSKEETVQENLSKKIQDTYSKNEDCRINMSARSCGLRKS